jgi:predicted adenylyl cyclase CyaB
MRRNLEVKAPYPDLGAARETVREVGAREAGIEVQTDTYFRVPNGRLKLREIEGKPAYLIAYDRPDRNMVRASAYHLIPVADPSEMKAALTAALGVRGEVRKRREIYLWHNVRIHLDEVAGLGRFIELEAVLSDSEGEAGSQHRLDELCSALAITPSETLGPSYVDLEVRE